MKKFGLISLILVLPVAITAVVYFSGGSTPQSDGDESIEIGYSKLRISLPVFVAKSEGLFKKHGVNVELKSYDTAQPLMQSLVEGKVDVAGYTALPITFNGMQRSKTDLMFLTFMIEDDDHRISYLLRPKGDGESEIKSVEDLAGKKVGILPTVAYRVWLEAIVRKAGLDPEVDISIQQIAPAQQAQALRSGGVDALFTNDPAATSAIRAGVAELVSEKPLTPDAIRNPLPFGTFNVRTDWAKKNPGKLAAIANALDEAIKIINTKPQQAKLAMRDFLPDTFKDDVAAYPDALYLTTADTKGELLQEMADLYYQLQMIPEKMDVAGAVYTP